MAPRNSVLDFENLQNFRNILSLFEHLLDDNLYDIDGVINLTSLTFLERIHA